VAGEQDRQLEARRRRTRATARRRRRPRERDQLKQRPSGRKAAGPAGPIPTSWPLLAIREQRTGRQLICLITEDGAKAQNYGGWEEVGRQRRIGFPDWTGGPLLAMEIACMFDGWASEQPVDRNCRMLESFARPQDYEQRPPTVRIDGPIPHTDKTWVIESIDWGTVIRGEGGHRRRVDFTLRLLEWVDANVIKRSPAKKRRKGGRRRTAKVRKRKGKPETLMQFAARVLDDPKKWRAIKKKNPKKCKDPRKLKVGMELKLP
jgi:hypothetical protein